MAGIESRDWYYNEFQHVGVDFESMEEVKSYDDEIGKGINQRDNCEESGPLPARQCGAAIL